MSLLALRGQSSHARVCQLLDQSGQRWILARDGYDAIDPEATFAARTNPGNLEVMRAGNSGPSQPDLGSYFLRISSSGLQYLAARLARGDINNSDCIALFVIF
jgi:hypothetical protein